MCRGDGIKYIHITIPKFSRSITRKESTKKRQIKLSNSTTLTEPPNYLSCAEEETVYLTPKFVSLFLEMRKTFVKMPIFIGF